MYFVEIFNRVARQNELITKRGRSKGAPTLVLTYEKTEKQKKMFSLPVVSFTRVGFYFRQSSHETVQRSILYYGYIVVELQDLKNLIYTKLWAYDRYFFPHTCKLVNQLP